MEVNNKDLLIEFLKTESKKAASLYNTTTEGGSSLKDNMKGRIRSCSEIMYFIEGLDWEFIDEMYATAADPIEAPENGEQDMINSPTHYTIGGIETIDVIESKLTKEQFEGYLLGSALKYMLRLNYKGEKVKDIRKASWFTRRLEDESTKTKED